MTARNANHDMVGSGRVRVYQESGVRWVVLSWCILQESGFSHREDVTFNSLSKEIPIHSVLPMRFQRRCCNSVLSSNTKMLIAVSFDESCVRLAYIIILDEDYKHST